jgi:predicted lipid-binding transport protein (Tim44 family)
MNGSFDISTLVFAILAIFVVWKLRSVLGTRTGHERPPFDPFAKRNAADPGKPGAATAERGNVVRLPGVGEAPGRPALSEQDDPARWAGFAEAGSPVAAGLDAIARADRSFAVEPFMEGARIAYETIIMAFAKGDKAALGPLLARDVLDGFSAAIDQRQSRGESVETTFVSLDEAVIEDAQVRGRTEQLTIRFESKLITVTRGRDGSVVDGSPDAVSAIIDHWTFAREIGSPNPNWKLVATETAH